MGSQQGRQPRVVTAPAQPAADLTINVPGSAEVVGPARTTFEDAVRDFAIDVLNAASIRETIARGSTSDEVQYTSAYFEYAKYEVRSAGYIRKKPKWQIWAKILGPILFMLAGVAIPSMLGANPWPFWGLVTGVTVVGGVACALVVELWKGGES